MAREERKGDVLNIDEFPASVIRDQIKDPAADIDGAPPNMGNFILPPIYTVQGKTGTAAKIYRPWDEAVRHSRENSKYMRNECSIMECLEARQRGTALLKWHLVPEDESSQDQQDLVDNLTKIIESIPDFLEYRRVLLEAIWYGHYGIQNEYQWKRVAGVNRVMPKRWLPLSGDKIVYRYDDLSGRYDDRQVGIRVGAGYNAGGWMSDGVSHQMHRKIEPTDYGLAYMLDEYERELLILHTHTIEDSVYEDPQSAGSHHGIGVRSRIYSSWLQMMDCLSNLMEYLERSSFGLEIWHYPQGNKQAHDAARQAAEERIGGGRSVLMVPRPQGEDADLYGVEHIEPGLGGVDALKSIITEYFGHKIKRYILGQTLSSEAEATGMGSGVADLHLATYLDIVRYDAIKLGETLTRDLVEPLKAFNFPEARNIGVRLIIDTEAAEVDKKLGAWEAAFNMGAKLKTEDVMGLIGAAIPTDDDETLQNPQFAEGGMGGMMGGGMPGMGGMMGQQPPPAGADGMPPSPDGAPGGGDIPIEDLMPPGEEVPQEQFKKKGETEKYSVSATAEAVRLDDENGNSYLIHKSGDRWQGVVVSPDGQPIDNLEPSSKQQLISVAYKRGGRVEKIVEADQYRKEGLRSLFFV